MKKLFIGGILTIVLGSIVFIFYQSNFAVAIIREEVKHKASQIKALNIETTAANIEITISKTDDITVNLDGKINEKYKEKYLLKVDESGEKLNISYISNENSPGIKFGTTKDVRLHIAIPEKLYRSLAARTSSGRIDIEDMEVQNINLKTTSGNQFIRNVKSKMSTSVQSTSGDIDINNNNLKHFLINSTSGTIEIDNLVSEEGRINTTSGNVMIKLKELAKRLDVETTSGDVETFFEQKPTSIRIDFKGNSGHSEIGLPNIMYENKGENSAIGLIGTGSNQLNVRTTSGNFKAE
ncbi:DUF4097 family beta strand repeat-containing protein [Metabacillus fastidiosus]|uniref:DUF4097 family beta strand repeat-containing protein n=1 Tax=Metabacillus fastidiosus TaxID=1458 RepID=UPI003D2AED89